MQQKLTSNYSATQGGAALLILLTILTLGSTAILMQRLGKHQTSALQKKQIQTQQSLESIKLALLGFAQQHGRLPRPATSYSDGREKSEECRSEPDCAGFIPWATLGVPRSDSWGNLYRYSVTAEFTKAPIFRTSAVANRRVLSRAPTGSLVYLEGQEICSNNKPCAAAVILSHGANNSGMSTAGITAANSSTGNLDEIHNTEAVLDFYSARPSRTQTNEGDEIDDQVAWMSQVILFQQMNATGKLP